MKIRDIIVLIVIFLIYAVLIISFDIGIPCVFYEITGLYCPGCGITRLCLSLFEGDIYQAFRYNPIIFINLPILFISGKKDRCMINQKAFDDSIKRLKDRGYRNIESKLFVNMFHEILNEKNNQIVYNTIINFL